MTVQTFDPTAVEVTMTDSARQHFLKQLQKSEQQAVRLSIEESGCSGYMYKVELVDSASEGDLQFSLADSLKLFVQNTAASILNGTQIDFKKDGLNEVVKFNNPNVVGECGCGESFVVGEH